jgi:hypothetical protein
MMGRRPDRVYVETSVPSAYVTTRGDAGSVYRREVTREWWGTRLRLFEPYVSAAVELELRKGTWGGQAEALVLIQGLPRLTIDDEVAAVARRYVRERLVPADLGGDALHLAVACVHEVDYLVTWNIRHLANPNKLEHLAVINRRLGLPTARVVTPEMLWLEVEP